MKIIKKIISNIKRIGMLKTCFKTILYILLKFKKFRLLYYRFNPSPYKNYYIFNDLYEKSVFLDFGANIGNVTEYINDNFNCQIYCYEPNPVAYAYLENRFKKYSNVKTLNYGVSKQTESLDFFLSKENALGENKLDYSQGGSLDKEKSNVNQKNSIKIKSININEILNNFTNIDIIKIDIEGHEYKILSSIIKNKYKIKKVVCELHKKSKNHIKEHNKIVAFLKTENLYDSWFYEWE